MSDRSWSLAARPQRREDIDAVDVDGELVVWDPVRARVHRLDPVATLIWQLLDGGATIDELADDIATVWETTNENAVEHLTALLAQLDEADLLVDSPNFVRFERVPREPGYLTNPAAP